MEKYFDTFKEIDNIDDSFDVTDDGISAMKDFIDDPDVDETEHIIDVNAEDEENIKDTYVGKIVLECPVCKTLLLKGAGEIDIDEDGEWADKDEECPYCYTAGGFKILGEIASIHTDKEDEEPVDGEEDVDNGEVEVDEEDKEELTERLEHPVAKSHTVRWSDEVLAQDIVDDKVLFTGSEKDCKKWIDERSKDAHIRDMVSDGDGKKAFKISYEIEKDPTKVVQSGITESLTKPKKTYRKKVFKEALNEASDWDKVQRVISELQDKVGNGVDESLEDNKDDIEADADDKKETAKADYEKEIDDADADKDDTLKKDHLNEAPIYGLNTQYDSRKSFGGKAQVDVQPEGETLYSYNTPVVKISKDGKVILLPKWDLSATTLRHVKEFLKQHGFKAETRNQIAADYISQMEECNKNLTEDFKNVTVTTDDTHMEMTSDEEGKVTVTTEPIKEDKEEVEVDREDIITPVSDATAKDIVGEEETEEIIPEEPSGEDTDIDIEEFDEEEFDNLGESYLKRVYDNVDSFKTTKGEINGNQLILEGYINFKSGKKAKTSFIFEGKTITKTGKIKLLGENKQITTNKKAFTLTGKMDGKKLITESLTYNYRGIDSKTNKSQRLYGTVKSK